MNKFATDAPVLLVISEKPYVASAALGAKVKKNDYRSIDIGILSAYITAAAADLGLSSCILGWFDDPEIRRICNLDGTVHLVITLGYPRSDDKLRTKKRKDMNELVKVIE
jgi:nitroreductase